MTVMKLVTKSMMIAMVVKITITGFVCDDLEADSSFGVVGRRLR